MTKRFMIVPLAVWALALPTSMLFAQTPDDEFWLGLELVAIHDEGELEGLETWRLYLHTSSPDDFLVSCSGDENYPMYLTSNSEPAWFQHELATTAFATDVNPAFFTTFPEFAFDSWLTIGAEDNTAAMDVISLADPNYDAFAAFEAGENVAATSTVGSAWFVLPIASNVEAIAGEDLRVLVAQFTTAGEISGQIQVQVFRNGNNQDEFRQVLPITYAETCDDLDLDGVCDEVDPCIGAFDVCGTCNGPGAIFECGCYDIPPGDCDCSGATVDALGDCGGTCCSDFNGNGICDNEEVMGCTYPDACNFNPSATVDEGTCFWPGSPCDDEDPNTVGDVFNSDCVCMGEVLIEGCTNNTACNYNEEATVNDWSCFFVGDPCNDENPLTINDTIDENCLCFGEAIIEGCTNPIACNYNADATVSDGSCLLVGDSCDDLDDTTINDVYGPDCVCSGVEIIEGCTDADACNYMDDANEDNASCAYVGDFCDDNDQETFDDVYNEICECVGTTGILNPVGQAFRLSPVPTSNTLHMKMSSVVPVTVVLTDMTGQIVMTKELSDGGVMDVRDLPSGNYTAMVVSNGTTLMHQKVVVIGQN